MKRLVLAGVALSLLAACQPAVPDSGAGVGFGSYDDYYKRREQALAGNGTVVPPIATVQEAPLDATAGSAAASPGPDAVVAAAEAALNSGVAPVSARPGNAPPPVVNTPTGISDENNFDAVSGERTIQDDAALLAQNRARYQVVQPTELPPRVDAGPNIVAYALETSNPVGNKIYRRSPFRTEAGYYKACRSFDTADLAQIAFLEKGGPERDRLGVDPDGDGYACDWNPVPFRLAKKN